MGLLDLSPYKVTNNISNVDATTQDSMLDAIQAIVNALTNANIDPAAAIALSKLAGFPSDATKYADGSGAWSVPAGGLVYRKTGTTDIVSATTGDMSAAAITIPGNAIGANGIVRVAAWGDYLNNTGSSQTVSFGIKFGSNAGQTFQITALTSASRFGWSLNWHIGNLAATGAQNQGGTITYVTNAGAGVTTNAIQPNAMTVDTTASVAVTLPAVLGASNALLSARCHGALVQVFAA